MDTEHATTEATADAGIPAVDIDLRTIGIDRDFFETWDDLRDAHGTFTTDPPATDGETIWVFTKYEDVYTAHRDTDILSNASIFGAPYIPAGPRHVGFVEMDPPLHPPWRQQLAPYFSPRVVESLEDEIRAVTRELIEEMKPNGGCEFVNEFANVLPTAMFLAIAGQPQSDRADLLNWADLVTHLTLEQDPDGSRRAKAMSDLQGYMRDVLDDRRAHPRDDFVTALTRMEIDGAPAPEVDVLGSAIVMFMGGLETVATSLAYEFHFLAEHPEYRRSLVENPALIPDAIEEFLRLFPVISSPRIVTRDAEYLGCPFKQGDRVWLQLAAANRDPDAFDRPSDVIFERQDNRHMTFGVGIHRCLGSHLARAELRIVHEEWHAAIPEYRIGDRSTMRKHGGQVAGFDALPLAWD